MTVNVVRHRNSAEGKEHTNALFAHLFEDPEDLAAHGLRVPVRTWVVGDTPDDGPRTSPPRFSGAKYNVVVVLLDAHFMLDSKARDWLSKLRKECEPGELLIASLSESALGLDTSINFIRLHEVADPDLRRQILLNRVTHALCRKVVNNQKPVEVFLSHAKADGEAIAMGVKRFLETGTGVDNFFDAQSILEGVDFKEEIHNGVRSQNALLAIRTDAYSTREWCRTEILDAKLGSCAVVVLDAFEGMEARGFAYLGNAPSVRWRPDDTPRAMEELLGVLLKETLRFRYFPVRVADVSSAFGKTADPTKVLPAPPELLTIFRRRPTDGNDQILVYPDPPLGTKELELIKEFAPDLRLITPTRLLTLS